MAESAVEFYLRELTNAERAKDGKQPLAYNEKLAHVAEENTQFNLSHNTFQHTNPVPSDWDYRAGEYGFQQVHGWQWDPNATPKQLAEANFTNLMNSPTHRDALLNPSAEMAAFDFVETVTGQPYMGFNGDVGYVSGETGWNERNPFLLGSVYRDLDHDRITDPGEGLGGIRVQVIDKDHPQNQWNTTTADTGAYQIELPPNDDYVVLFRAADGSTIYNTQQVHIGLLNVDHDYTFGF